MWPPVSPVFSPLSLLVFFVGHGLLDAPLFSFSWGYFAAPAANDFLDGQKVTKEPLGGRLKMDTACPYSPPPLESPYTVTIPLLQR